MEIRVRGFTTGTESVQDLLCFSRQVAGGSLGCALLFSLTMPIRLQRHIWVVSSHQVTLLVAWL